MGDLGCFIRGYTGHEHLDQFGIINMNGRVYDPATAQFFSPDPFVQSPGDWQNYNRYAYCLNNPVMYTDPSGYQYDYVSPASDEINQTEMPGNRDTGFRNNFNYWSAHQGSISYNDDGKYYYSGGGEASWGEARGYLFRGSKVTYRSNGKEAISFLNAVSANSNSTSLILFGYQSNKQTNTWKYIQYNTNTLKCYIPYTNIEYNTSGSIATSSLDGFNILEGINNLFDEIWNSSITRAYTGDALAFNFSNLTLTFLGGGSNSTGFLLPLRGPNAFQLHFINTASFRIGVQVGGDVSVSKMWFNGPVKNAYVNSMYGKGYSFDINLGLAAGFGPGVGGFASVDDRRNEITWFGYNVSFGYGLGASVGIDYSINPIKLW